MKKNQDTYLQVRELLKVQKISQVQLASRIGIYPSHLNLYLQGKSDIASQLLLEILRELGINLNLHLAQQIKKAQSTATIKGSEVDSTNVFDFILQSMNKSARVVLVKYIIKYANAVVKRDISSAISFLKQHYLKKEESNVR